jgi:hypothetical protein
MFARAAKLDGTKLQAALAWLGRKELLNCKRSRFFETLKFLFMSGVFFSKSFNPLSLD